MWYSIPASFVVYKASSRHFKKVYIDYFFSQEWRTFEISIFTSQRSNDWACAWFKLFWCHFWWLPVSFPFHHTKFPRSTSQSTSRTRAISVLRPIILPLQTFFSRVLLLRQQAFSSGNLPPERPTTTTSAIKTQVFMFRYERVNSTRKFIIVAEIVSLLKKIYKRYALLELCLK